MGAFFLLLMLSALVETPAMEESGGIAQDEPAAVYHAKLLPYAIPIAEHSAVTPSPHARMPVAVIMPGILAALPACSSGRDANGRWVREKRYVQSAYQVFHQDVAGG